MVRTQIQLQEAQYRRFRRWTERLGVSLSEGIRRCVAAHLDREERLPSREERVRTALSVCGRSSDPSGPSKVARDHDRHLVEAYRG